MIINRLVIFQFFWYNVTNIMIGSVIMTEENIDIKEETADEEILEEEKKKVLDFFITTLNGMAYGLFSTLIIGTIIATIGQLFLKGNNPFCQLVGNALGDGKTGASYVFQVLTGAGIGVGIALMLKMKPLETIVLAGAGEISAYFSLTTNFFILIPPNLQIFYILHTLTANRQCFRCFLRNLSFVRKYRGINYFFQCNCQIYAAAKGLAVVFCISSSVPALNSNQFI